MRFQCTNAVWWNYAFARLRGNNGSGLTIQEKNFAAQRFCGKPVEQHQKNERAGRASESNCARSRGYEYQAPSFCDPFKSVACLIAENFARAISSSRARVRSTFGTPLS